MKKLTENILKNLIRQTLKEGEKWDAFKYGYEHGAVKGLWGILFGDGEGGTATLAGADPKEKLQEVVAVLEELIKHIEDKKPDLLEPDKLETIKNTIVVLNELVEKSEEEPEEGEEEEGSEEGEEDPDKTQIMTKPFPGQYRYGEREPEKIAEVLLARPKGMI